MEKIVSVWTLIGAAQRAEECAGMEWAAHAEWSLSRGELPSESPRLRFVAARCEARALFRERDGLAVAVARVTKVPGLGARADR